MKKLLILLVLIGGVYGFFRYYLPSHGVSGVLQSVKGIQTTIQNQNYQQFLSTDRKSSSVSALPVKTNTLQNIQQQIAHLKVADIASSSPEIQQIIKQLQKLPNDKIKATCMQLCGGL